MGWNEMPHLRNHTFKLVTQNNARRGTLSGEKSDLQAECGLFSCLRVSLHCYQRAPEVTGEITAHSEFQARTAAVRVFFIDLEMTVLWIPESFCFKQQNPPRRSTDFKPLNLNEL